jgi:hypothetical protein
MREKRRRGERGEGRGEEKRAKGEMVRDQCPPPSILIDQRRRATDPFMFVPTTLVHRASCPAPHHLFIVIVSLALHHIT